jgi:hypothetical protein
LFDERKRQSLETTSGKFLSLSFMVSTWKDRHWEGLGRQLSSLSSWHLNRLHWVRKSLQSNSNCRQSWRTGRCRSRMSHSNAEPTSAWHWMAHVKLSPDWNGAIALWCLQSASVCALSYSERLEALDKCVPNAIELICVVEHSPDRRRLEWFVNRERFEEAHKCKHSICECQKSLSQLHAVA